MLYADSLDAQRCFPFVEAVKNTKGEILYGPRGKTDGWQPIDCGALGSIFKALFRQEQEHWMDLMYTREDTLEQEPNWRRWERDLTISMKGVLATWWRGEACKKLLYAYAM